jgi:hypothetical protein
VPPAYRFLDRWVIAAPIERVYEVIGDPLGYERWWTDFVIKSSGDPGEPVPGKRNELLVKAYLPYKVNFGLEVLEAERHLLAAVEGFRRDGAVDAGGNGRRDGGDARLASIGQPPPDQVPDAGAAPALSLEPQLGDAQRRATTARVLARA